MLDSLKWKPTENNKLEASSILAISQYHHLMISSFHKLCHGTVFFALSSTSHLHFGLGQDHCRYWKKMMQHGSGRNHGQSWRNLNPQAFWGSHNGGEEHCSHESTTWLHVATLGTCGVAKTCYITFIATPSPLNSVNLWSRFQQGFHKDLDMSSSSYISGATSRISVWRLKNDLSISLYLWIKPFPHWIQQKLYRNRPFHIWFVCFTSYYCFPWFPLDFFIASTDFWGFRHLASNQAGSPVWRTPITQRLLKWWEFAEEIQGVDQRIHWIGLREFCRTAQYFKETMVSCRFSLKPIQWHIQEKQHKIKVWSLRNMIQTTKDDMME